MARPTEERKGHNQIFRVSDEMREWLQLQAKDKTVSDYLRELVSFAMQNKLCNAKPSNFAMQNEIAELRKENEDLKEKSDFYLEQYQLLEKVMENNEVSDDAQYAIKDLIGMIRATYDENQNPGDADTFFADLHDKIESGEWQIENSKLKLGSSDVFKVLNTSEVKKWLKPVWDACEEKGRPYTDGLKAVFKHGAPLAEQDIYGDRQ